MLFQDRVELDYYKKKKEKKEAFHSKKIKSRMSEKTKMTFPPFPSEAFGPVMLPWHSLKPGNLFRVI